MVRTNQAIYEKNKQPLMKKETMTATEWKMKEEKLQQDFFEHGTRSNTPKYTVRKPNRTGQK